MQDAYDARVVGEQSDEQPELLGVCYIICDTVTGNCQHTLLVKAQD